LGPLQSSAIFPLVAGCPRPERCVPLLACPAVPRGAECLGHSAATPQTSRLQLRRPRVRADPSLHCEPSARPKRPGYIAEPSRLGRGRVRFRAQPFSPSSQGALGQSVVCHCWLAQQCPQAETAGLYSRAVPARSGSGLERGLPPSLRISGATKKAPDRSGALSSS
jgi:hypothetical protein